VIEEGASVRERQAIINLPDLEHMKIDARIHESRISRVIVGQPVEIEIDAIPGDPYRGKLQSISSVPVPGSWPNTDLKEYEAIIEILDQPARVRKLKPGMTAQVRIIVEDRKQDVLQIPVQSVVSFSGQYFTYVITPKGPERRELKVGDANDEFMEVLDGVALGESVVMSPRTHFSKELSVLLKQRSQRRRSRIVKNWIRRIASRPELLRAKAREVQVLAVRRAVGARSRRVLEMADRARVDRARWSGRWTGAGGPGGGGPPDPKVMFESMDKNKDGIVTKEEHPRPEFFDRSDKDGDGKLTLEEMQSAVRERMQQGQGRPQ
jgi:HlyD family secretion protein